jgi:PPK2 family polyphosphate:nucleotide phosphotransferase
MDQFQVPLDDFRLSNFDPADTRGLQGASVEQILNGNRRRIAEVQNVLYAEGERSLLVVLQSMDTGGKDPIIRDVLNLTNPQACRAVAFKKAAGSEQRHDVFWRFHLAMPEKGEIVVFNRSYFDEIIADEAHGDQTAGELEWRCRQVNAFESLLVNQGISIAKIFLHISKEEQKRRLQERIDDPTRQWELSESDFEERKYWDGYMKAYESVIRLTNERTRPWYLIPSDDREFRDAAASVIIRGALERLDPKYPPPKMDLRSIVWY